MVIGIGTDIVKIERIARIIQRLPQFIDRVFTPAEAEYCLSKAVPAQSFAARFAAKEAVMKAIGSGWSEGIAWQDIEVTIGPNGNPGITVHNACAQFMESKQIHSIHVSLAHEKEYAIAYVLLER
jgi:holo-[acyl-carrier protein] synthase